jgi:hypothetical protein
MGTAVFSMREIKSLIVGEAAHHHVRRAMHAFDIPQGCLTGDYPECNPLMPLSLHAQDSPVPASKSIQVRLRKSELVKPGA